MQVASLEDLYILKKCFLFRFEFDMPKATCMLDLHMKDRDMASDHKKGSFVRSVL